VPGQLARRVREATRGNPPVEIPAGRPESTTRPGSPKRAIEAVHAVQGLANSSACGHCVRSLGRSGSGVRSVEPGRVFVVASYMRRSVVTYNRIGDSEPLTA
jgi:hypothetical protein